MVQMPTPIFVIFIGIVLYLIFRDDIDKPKKPPVKRRMMTIEMCGDAKYLKEQEEKELAQISELN